MGHIYLQNGWSRRALSEVPLTDGERARAEFYHDVGFFFGHDEQELSDAT